MKSDQSTYQDKDSSKHDERYAQARERHLAILEQGFDLGSGGGPLVDREALRERDGGATPRNRSGPAGT